MTAATAEPAITERTKALLPVHIFGNPAPVPELMELAAPRGIKVLEDAAQAHGARSAAARPARWATRPSSASSHRRTSAASETAAPSSPPPPMSRRWRAGCASTAPRTSGPTPRRATTPGSTRCTPPGFACCCRTWTSGPPRGGRRRRPTRTRGSASWSGSRPRPMAAESCWHLFVVRSPDRDRLGESLARRGSVRAPTTRPRSTRQPAVGQWAPAEPLPNTEAVCAEILALPMGTALDPDAPRRGHRGRAPGARRHLVAKVSAGVPRSRHLVRTLGRPSGRSGEIWRNLSRAQPSWTTLSAAVRSGAKCRRLRHP